MIQSTGQKSFYEISQKNNSIKDSSELVVDDDGSDSDSALSPGPEGESEAHHRSVVFIINIIGHYHCNLSIAIITERTKCSGKGNLKEEANQGELVQPSLMSNW